jgi:hypothetical protein
VDLEAETELQDVGAEERPVDQRETFIDGFLDSVLKVATEYFGEDVSIEQAEEILSRGLQPAVNAATDVLVASLRRGQANMLRGNRRRDATFRRRLRKRWGKALDALYTAIVLAEEMGADHDRRNALLLSQEGDDTLFEALTRLHARACRIAFEVHALLEAGFAAGGLARCRTLHEIAVTALLLEQSGKRPDHQDIGERYLLHDVVINYKDALQYQSNCEALGYEPYTEAEMTALKADYDAIMRRFGTGFAQPYGWAGAAVGNPSPKFSDLETAAGLEHLRSHYKWASHETHADAKGARLNVHDFDGFHVKASGPIDTGLADPGDMAAISLYQVTVATLLADEDCGPYELTCLAVLKRFVDSVGDLFMAAYRAEHSRREHRPELPDRSGSKPT